MTKGNIALADNNIIELIKSVLEKSGADGWRITDTLTEGWEFYFIRHDLDQNRAKNVEHINVKVFKKSEDGAFLGDASDEIAPSATENEIKKTVDSLVMKAGYIKNPFYKLNPPEKSAQPEGADFNAAGISVDFLNAMNELPESSDADINSYEIFASKVTRRILTSEGTDITEIYPSSMIEVVVNARDEDHEIELYRMYHSGTCDKEGLKDSLIRTFQYGKDRLKTEKTPPLEKADVIFSTDDAVAIYDYFRDRLNAAMLVRKISDWEIGKSVADAAGDKVTLTARRELENSSANFAYDEEGAPIRDLVLLNENVPENYWGTRMYTQYLGMDRSGIVYNYEISGGTQTEAELRTGKYLEIVEFSDFQVDSVTGDIFGEIRLGYYHDGENVRIITGGSVSGSMAQFVKNMHFSKELVQYNNVKIPAVTRLADVTITGAEA